MAEEARSYFVSDVHLGVHNDPEGLREKNFASFLDSLPESTKELYLLGDIFDFWVDYKYLVPRGYTRVLGRLAALSDRGVTIYFFKGNHDYWVTDYFKKELGAVIVDEPYRIVKIGERNVCIGHGDCLNCSDWKARFIFKLFRNKFLIRLLRAMPPSWIFSFAHGWSAKSRKSNGGAYAFQGENSDIYKFADSLGKTLPIDYYIFGHLHTPAHIPVRSGGELFILGDWAEGENYLYLSGMNISGRGLPNTHS